MLTSTMQSSSSFLQTMFGQCTSPGLPSCTSGRNDSTKALVTHRFDRPMRCIIDPKEMVAMIKYQNDEVIRQEQADNSVITDDSFDTPPPLNISPSLHSDAWDVESSILGTEFSFGARTDITTATGATPVAANRDRYAAGRKSRSKAEQFRVLEAIAIERAPRARSNFIPLAAKQNALYDDPSIACVHSIFAKDQKSRSKMTKDLPPGVQVTTGAGCGILFAQCSQDDNMESLRKEYGKALHLKVKAHMGSYYFGHYLRQFPDSPVPESLDLSRTASFEGPARTWTEDSLSLPGVNYGDFVHSSPIQMMVDDSDFMDLGITGSLGLVKRFEVSQSGQRLKSPNHYKVLLNRRSGVPLAVCALKSPHGHPVVRIYTAKQRFFGQKSPATTRNLGLAWCEQPYPLYPWAEFTAEGEFPEATRYSLFMSTGAEGRFEATPSYRAHHRTIGSPEILVMGKTETEADLEGAALISLQSSSDDEDYFAVSVARGIDPALMMCLASIVDETMENTLRAQCAMKKRQKGKLQPLNPNVQVQQPRNGMRKV
jgi:hypothetical protein